MATMARIVHVVNRTLGPLEVMDDGIPWPIRPGYKQELVPAEEGGDGAQTRIVGAGPGGTVLMEPLPFFAAERAKRQNPQMGTEDPMNPSDFVSLIAVPEWGEPYDYLEPSDAIERLDREQLPEELQNIQVVAARGGRKKQGRRNPKTGRFEKYTPGGRDLVRGEAHPALENLAFAER